MAKARLADASTGGDSVKQRALTGGLTPAGDLSQRCPNGHEDELENARKILMPVVGELGATRLNTTSGVAKLSVVGIGMRSHSGVAARMFECLGRNGINIQLVSTSEIKIAVIIDEKDAERATQLIHAEFGLGRLLPAASATKPLGEIR